MLGKPRAAKTAAEPRPVEKRRRFQVRKLEPRIAPKYFYNPNAGKYVGNGPKK